MVNFLRKEQYHDYHKNNMFNHIPHSTPAFLQFFSGTVTAPGQLVSLSSCPIQLAFLNPLMLPPALPKHEFLHIMAPMGCRNII